MIRYSRYSREFDSISPDNPLLSYIYTRYINLNEKATLHHV